MARSKRSSTVKNVNIVASLGSKSFKELSALRDGVDREHPGVMSAPRARSSKAYLEVLSSAEVIKHCLDFKDANLVVKPGKVAALAEEKEAAAEKESALAAEIEDKRSSVNALLMQKLEAMQAEIVSLKAAKADPDDRARRGSDRRRGEGENSGYDGGSGEGSDVMFLKHKDKKKKESKKSKHNKRKRGSEEHLSRRERKRRKKEKREETRKEAKLRRKERRLSASAEKLRAILREKKRSTKGNLEALQSRVERLPPPSSSSSGSSSEGSNDSSGSSGSEDSDSDSSEDDSGFGGKTAWRKRFKELEDTLSDVVYVGARAGGAPHLVG